MGVMGVRVDWLNAQIQQARCPNCGGNLGDWANPNTHARGCPYPRNHWAMAQPMGRGIQSGSAFTGMQNGHLLRFLGSKYDDGGGKR